MPGTFGVDELVGPADMCGHDGQAGRHGLLDRVRKPFRFGTENEEIEGGEHVRHVGSIAQKSNVTDAQRFGQCDQFVLQPARAGDHGAEGDPTGTKKGQGAQPRRLILDRHEPAHRADDELVVTKTEICARRGTMAWMKAIEVDAVSDDLNAIDREADGVGHPLTETRGDREDTVDPMPGPALDQRVAPPGFERSMLPMHHEGHTGETCGDETFVEGRPAMGVHHIGPFPAHQARDAADQQRIVTIATVEFEELDPGRKSLFQRIAGATTADAADHPRRVERIH